MITHTEAQKLNEELRTIRNTLGFIARKRSKQAREQRTQLETRRDEIEKVLEDAPPFPLDPAEVWDKIEWWAKRHIKKAAEIREKFLEKFEGSPAWAMSSWGQDIVIADRIATSVGKVLDMGATKPDVAERVDFILERLTDWAEHLKDQIIRESRSGFMRSTSGMGNLISLWENEADAKLYDELVGSWGGLHINDLAESLQSWREWQKEIETEKEMA